MKENSYLAMITDFKAYIENGHYQQPPVLRKDIIEPKLRFKEFYKFWRKQKVSDLLERVSNPVSVELDEEYQQIGIRSHGKGIFHKEPVTGLELGNKRVFWVEEDVFTVNIVFAWEQAVAVTSSHEKGMIASHRFPMYRAKPQKADVQFLLRLFLTKKGKNYLELASPGGAGRNKTLGQKNFEELDLIVPDEAEEQTKIATFLTAIDERISQLAERCSLLEQYKKAVMQKIFSQELRFKDEEGREFPAWEEKRLGDVFIERTTRIGDDDIDTYSISAGKGFVSQKEKFGKDISGMQNEKYIKLEPFDFAYNKGSSKSYLYGCVYPNVTNKQIGVPNVFICFSGLLSISVGFYAKLFEFGFLDKNLRMIISSSVRMDGLLNVNKNGFFDIKIPYPCIEEQEKIAGFLAAVDDKIAVAKAKLEAVRQYKQGLLQQMFV